MQCLAGLAEWLLRLILRIAVEGLRLLCVLQGIGKSVRNLCEYPTLSVALWVQSLVCILI